jgi:hypothetical protein
MSGCVSERRSGRGAQLAALREVFCEAARVLGVTVRTPHPHSHTHLHAHSPSESSVALLMKHVLAALQSRAELLGAVAGAVTRACRGVRRGLQCFALQDYSRAHRSFEKVLALQLEVLPGELEVPPAAALACCFFCRLQMYCCLHVNNCFLDSTRAGLYVAGVECAELYQALLESEHVLTCLAVRESSSIISYRHVYTNTMKLIMRFFSLG